MPALRIVCIAFWAFLTLLLLVPDPLALAPHTRTPSYGVHFTVFTVLAFLVVMSRFPLRRIVLAGCLIAYAIATESLQMLIPGRYVEGKDFAENLIGLAVGAAIGWVVLKRRKE